MSDEETRDDTPIETSEPAEEDQTAQGRIKVVNDGIKRRWYAIHAHSGQ